MIHWVYNQKDLDKMLSDIVGKYILSWVININDQEYKKLMLKDYYIFEVYINYIDK